MRRGPWRNKTPQGTRRRNRRNPELDRPPSKRRITIRTGKQNHEHGNRRTHFRRGHRRPPHGRTPSARARLHDTIEQIRLADEVGLDVFGVGEHHRSDFIASAPSIILAAPSPNQVLPPIQRHLDGLDRAKRMLPAAGI